MKEHITFIKLEDKKNSVIKAVSPRKRNKVKIVENNSQGKENNKNEIYGDTNSVSSSIQNSNYSKGISSIGINRIKKDKISENYSFSLLQKIIYFFLFFILIIIIFQYFYLQKMENDIIIIIIHT